MQSRVTSPSARVGGRSVANVRSIVITGGCGFLGTALAEKIRENGVTLPNGQRLSDSRLHLWDRAGSVIPAIESATFTAIDIADADPVQAQMPSDVALIYHLAAVVGTWPTLFDTALAYRLGFTGDADFGAMLDQALRMK
jgi:nucleoside-diphosphate-sugar epimerase